ncbi:MAG: hypothetical protein OEV62_01905 [Actinomycetota bacterium]|nr:hypothetical protein [Actinomycetota bacterium]MDH4354106.1 hypothetical protein [Actinomycetota bacterium]
MSSTVLLVTSHAISEAAAQAFVSGKKEGSRYLVVVPARVAGGYDTFLAENSDKDSGAGPDAPKDAVPHAHGGRGAETVEVDYGYAEATAATALAGAVSAALGSAHVAVDSCTLPHHRLPEAVARLAHDTPADEVVIATHAVSAAHLLGADLTARVKRALQDLGSDIPVERHHF